MKLTKFVKQLDEQKDYFYEWVQDSNDKNTFYFWRNEDRGYMTRCGEKIVENISNSENYFYHPFDDDILKEEFDILLAKRMDELNKLDNCEDIFEKWLIDEEDNSKYYYWKGENKGYIAEVYNDGKKLPRVTKVESIDGDYLNPSIMKEFKDYKIKRALNKKLEEIKDENIDAKKKIFGRWTEDKDRDNTYYFWKNENEGYIALVENKPLPEIIKFEAVDREYFEPRTLEAVTNHKVKKVLDKKIK
jgi:hypothetical protein